VPDQILEKGGLSSSTSALVNDYLSIFGSISGIAAIRSLQMAAFPTFHLPVATKIRTMDPQTIRFSQNSIRSSSEMAAV